MPPRLEVSVTQRECVLYSAVPGGGRNQIPPPPLSHSQNMNECSHFVTVMCIYCGESALSGTISFNIYSSPGPAAHLSQLTEDQRETPKYLHQHGNKWHKNQPCRLQGLSISPRKYFKSDILRIHAQRKKKNVPRKHLSLGVRVPAATGIEFPSSLRLPGRPERQ